MSPPYPTLGHLSTLHNLTLTFLNIDSNNIFLPSMPRSPKRSLSFMFSHKKLVFISHLAHAQGLILAPRLLFALVFLQYVGVSKTRWNFGDFLLSNIPSLCGPDILLRTMLLQILSLGSSFTVRDQVPHLYQSTCQL